MFKKLLTVGALATALIGGIGTASASKYCNPQDPAPMGGGKYYRFVSNPSNNFANVFTENTKFGKITWHFKERLGSCEFHTGRTAFQAYYEGRISG
ncbi:hypothetical protein [Xenorhabdus doucetiae]|uniref:Antimicrobial protein n=1 Tax=Xenorhabdus doucetiae TaxID=351671 RepID=A0A068QT62_9GAMM|nr:hypothetical protein [Xenorhabdus doucetiae]TYP10800.1 hypothetical protein LY16_01184 [Xenorhabdus doucetiae]CDG17811.1 conserved exported protein of unknown function [Xenorhabdus doucetiae]